MRELTEAMGLRAPSNVYVSLKAAADQGRIRVTHNHAPHLTPHYTPWWIAHAIDREVRWRKEINPEQEQWHESTTP